MNSSPSWPRALMAVRYRQYTLWHQSKMLDIRCE